MAEAESCWWSGRIDAWRWMICKINKYLVSTCNCLLVGESIFSHSANNFTNWQDAQTCTDGILIHRVMASETIPFGDKLKEST